MVPTKRLWVCILIGVPLGAIAYQFEFPWALLAYNLMLLGAAIADYRLCPDLKALSWKRVFDKSLSVRVPNKVSLELVNDGPEAIEGFIRDEPPAGSLASAQNETRLRLAPRSAQTLRYTITPGARGSDFFRGIFLRVKCPMGLVFRQVKLAAEQPVRVYPNILALREFDLLKQKGALKQMGIRKSRAKGLGMEFESLRDYALGDDYRKIDWKATARRNKLVVRQFEQERNQSVLLCIDVGRRMLSEVDGVSKLDHVLDSVLMLAHAAAQAGDLVGLMLYSDSVRRYIAPRKGRSQIGYIIEALHDVVAEPVETDFAGAFGYLSAKYKRRSLVVNFTDLDDDAESQGFASAFGPMAKRHVALVARVGDPSLKAVATGAIVESNDLYRRAAALTVNEDRKRAGIALTAYGMHQLEAEPQDLAAELVSFYFMVKERSLL